ncbi:MAG: DUF1080 domain-containing protein [Rubripirellula sp.]|nr:DUF1080 domain-containing protein [Rubripirellula sp.]
MRHGHERCKILHRLLIPDPLTNRNVTMLVRGTTIAFFLLASFSGFGLTHAEEGKWIQLFNGKNLDGWTPKIRYHELGENFANTFRVEDGLLKVGYDGYSEFNETFGHLFYKDDFSHYRIRVEYRFVGDQCKGGPGWAIRNSGIMIHGEQPEQMSKDQDFPTSIEVQLLGGDGQKKRTTLNLCTPGTNVFKDGKLFLPHCTSSNSATYHGPQWVTAEVEVRGNQIIKHTIDGKVVLEYTKPQLDPRDDHAKKLADQNGSVNLSRGTISLQSESHPVHFRKVELMVLEPSDN